MKKIIVEIKNLTSLEKVFLIFLGLSEIYYFYRYIFRFSSSISPIGYILTPFWLQLGKFVLVFVFFVIMAIFILSKFKWSEIVKQFSKKIFWFPVLLFVLYFALSLLKFTNHWDNYGFTQSLKMLFVIPVLFFIPFIWKDKSPFSFLKIFLVFSIVYNLLYNFIMIGLFYSIGRLPGLAFSDILGRFGGGWDDPNGFAAFIVLLIAVLLVIRSDKLKGKFYWYYAILLSLLIISLIYTFSVTGLVGLFVVIVLFFFFKKLSWKKFLPIPIIGILFTIIFYYLNYFFLIYYGKLGSSAGHLNITSVQTANLSIIGIIGKVIFGSTTNIVFLENFYIQFFNNFGLVGVTLLAFILGLTTFRAFKGYSKTERDKEPQKKIIFLISGVYLVAFVIMNAVIPIFQDFPMNLFVWVLIGIVWILQIKDYDKPAELIRSEK